MSQKEKFNRDEVLKLLDIPAETLSSYEMELEIASPLVEESPESFSNDEVESIRVLHRLLESGMSKNEIRILASFSEVLRNVDIEGSEGIKNLLSLSPIYRLKQSLNVAKQELESIKSKTKELEGKLLKEIEFRAQIDMQNISLSAEVEAKQKTIDNLDKSLSETLLQKAHLESQLAVPQVAPQENKNTQNLVANLKNKKTKDLYEIIIQKDVELAELKKRIEENVAENQKLKEENLELSERLEFMEDDIAEIEQEVEERYQEQIKSIREQVEGLIDSKQKEWDSFFNKSSEQQKKELLTLQSKHEAEIQKLKEVMDDQVVELEQLKLMKNPLAGMFKKR